GYDEMLELASTGAKVLHNRCVEMAKKYNVELEVLSSMVKAPGTIVKEDSLVERMMISGVAADKNVARISVIGIPDMPGRAFNMFNLLSKENINVDIILQSVGRNGTKDISFTVSQDNADDAVRVLEENLRRLGAQDVTCHKDVAKVSIVGAGMTSNPGVAAKMFEALYNADVNIHMISTSEIKISVLIDVNKVEEAVVSIHEQFRMYEKK
ncbi:MAG: ACT domain-containing protein, partial [Firmicutes bacterium]|nr:ACT domain-containing protein [Bacillota bacterium]